MTNYTTLAGTLALLALSLTAPARAEEPQQKNYCFFGAKAVTEDGTEERGWVCIPAFGPQQAAEATTRDTPVRTAEAETR
jgi:hypothetical protein